MYIYLIVVPIFNFLDAIFDFVLDVDTYLLILNVSYLFTAFVTAYLAIRHFVQASKRRMEHGE